MSEKKPDSDAFAPRFYGGVSNFSIRIFITRIMNEVNLDAR